MAIKEKVRFPTNAGLMILPWVTLFPGALLPLRIFEERYRHMLKDAIDSHRMFAIAHLDEILGEDPDFNWNAIGTLGVLRACVTNPDGTSNLILQGIARVQFTNDSLAPYPRADIKILRDSSRTSPEIETLRGHIQQNIQKPVEGETTTQKGFTDHLPTIESPASFCDMVASTKIKNPLHRRDLLEELDVSMRLEKLADYLENRDSIVPGIWDGELEDLEAEEE